MTSINLLQINQASIEYDTSGFATAASSLLTSAAATITRITTDFWQGVASLHLNTGANGGSASGVEIAPGLAIPAGTQVTISFYYKTSGSGGALRLYDYTNGNSPAGGVSLTTPTTGWQRGTYTYTQTTATRDLRFCFRSSTASQDVWIDGLQVEFAAAASAFTLPDPLASPSLSLATTANLGIGVASSFGVVASLTGTVLLGTHANSYTVIHAGQDITLYVDDESIHVESTFGQGAGLGKGGSGRVTTATAIVRLGPAAKAIGAGSTPSGHDVVRQGETIIYDATGTTVFGGFLTKIEDATDSINVATKFTCTDYWMHLDRVEANELYTGFGDVDIMKALLTKYASWVDQSQLPSANNMVFDKRPAKGTLRELLQGLADATGWMIWIDANKVIHYVSPSSASTAPFGLSDDPDFITTFGHAVTAYQTDDAAAINRVYFYGGKNVSPDFTQDLKPQITTGNKTFALLYFPHEATDGKIHITKNGTDLVMYSVFDTDPTHFFKSKGGNADVLINRDSEVLLFDTDPTGATSLTATYRYNTPLVIVLSSASSHAFYGEWYDARITDQSVYDSVSAMQRCRVLLAEQAFGLTTLQVVCTQAGIFAGQLLQVKNDLKGINGTYLVQKVTTEPLGAGFFQYTLDLGAWNWNLLDLLVQQARINNPTDSSTEEDLTIIQAQQSLETAVVVTVITTSVRASGVYYSRTTAVGDGHDAYSGFFTVTG